MNLKELLKKPKVHKILLSIKPKYVEEIRKGNKMYEYRKTIFKNTDVDTVIIYASSPISKVIGEFKIKKILKGEPNNIWDITKDQSGVSKAFYDEYFEKKRYAYAIEIIELKFYEEPIDIYTKFKVKAPQSFCYIK